MTEYVKNILFKNFGSWKAIACVGTKKNNGKYFLCKCMVCGEERQIGGSKLIYGKSNYCGKATCRQKRDPTPIFPGQKFGKLTIVKQSSHKNGYKTKFLCECECGTKKEIIKKTLLCGKVQSCGCARRKLPDGEMALNREFRNYKRSAKYRNIDFNLTKKEFKSLLLGNCVYCGTKPLNIKTDGGSSIAINGADRVDSKKCYNVKNCVSCCKRCNYMKSNYSFKEFKIWLKRLVNKIIKEEKKDG